MEKIKKRFSEFKKTNAWIVLSIFFSALLFTIALTIFIDISGTIPTGVTGFAKIINYIFPTTTKYFSYIYLAINLPIIIFFYNKVKKPFIYKTILFFFFQTLIGIGFTFTPNKLIIENLIPIKGIKDFSNVQEQKEFVRNKIWPIFLFAMIGIVILSIAITISWKAGSSTGGSEIYNYYLSSKKKIAIGHVFKTVNIIFCIFSFIIGIIFDKNLRNHAFLLLIVTFLNIFVLSLLIDNLYPKYSKVKVEIFSNKIEEIHNKLKEINYIHAHSMFQFISGYDGQKKQKIVSIMYLYEQNDFIKIVESIDNNAWISIYKVSHVKGELSGKNIEP